MKTTLEHQCRDEKYDLYKDTCRACISQLSINGRLHDLKKKQGKSYKASEVAA